MIAVTGANGHLGQLVIEGLVERVPANQIIAAVRSPEKASSFATLGVQVREADYTRPETLSTALHDSDGRSECRDQTRCETEIDFHNS